MVFKSRKFLTLWQGFKQGLSLKYKTRSISLRVACFASFFVFFLFSSNSIFSEGKKTSSFLKSNHFILVSVDGLPSEYLREDSPLWDKLPHFRKLKESSYFYSSIQSVNPTITYPSHTSMVTGVDPGVHGIRGNLPFDPFHLNRGGWMWYAEDIQVPTLWKLAHAKKKKVGNVFWPVTLGAREIDYNLPQFWRERIPEDDKLLRAVSTKGLHKEMEDLVGLPLNETTGDRVKLQTAVRLFQKYKPNLLLVYTTDLDSAHHAKGMHSEKAISKIVEIDAWLGEFMKELNLWNRKDVSLVLTSDHGFRTSNAMCYPNVYLASLSVFRPTDKKYDFVFRSLGGMGILYSTSGEMKDDKFRDQIQSDWVSQCPGTRFVSEGEEFLRLREELDPKAVGFFLSEGDVYFSSSWDQKIVFEKKSEFYTHGFPKNQEEMNTIAFVFPRRNSVAPPKIESVKDIFAVCKQVLGL